MLTRAAGAAIVPGKQSRAAASGARLRSAPQLPPSGKLADQVIATRERDRRGAPDRASTRRRRAAPGGASSAKTDPKGRHGGRSPPSCPALPPSRRRFGDRSAEGGQAGRVTRRRLRTNCRLRSGEADVKGLTLLRAERERRSQRVRRSIGLSRPTKRSRPLRTNVGRSYEQCRRLLAFRIGEEGSVLSTRRYAKQSGKHHQPPYPHAWRYREGGIEISIRPSVRSFVKSSWQRI